MSHDNYYVLTILHVNILSTIDLFSVLLTSFFKQGSMALSPTIGKRKRVFRPFAQIYFRISPSHVGRGKQASSNGN